MSDKEKDTKKTLESSVSSIRAQGLSFNKDGMDFTLQVPDTQDVKNVFGTMSNTIVTQEEHIDELNTNMMAMEQEFKKDQERIMQWAHESIEKLVQKNEVLTNMLNQTRQQMRAMTYNMKGIDDGAKDDDLVQAMKDIEEGQTSKPAPIVTRQGSLFATEEGGAMSPSKLSLAPPVQEAEPPKPKEEPPKPKEESPRPKPEIKTDIQPEPDVEAGEVKSLLAGALQEESPPSTPRAVVLSEDRSPKALWRWAFRKVAAKNMVKRIGFSFMNTMVDKEETVISRLEKIEKKLFFLPNDMMTYTNSRTDKLDEKLTGEIARLDESLVAFDKQVCENFNEMGVKVADVTNNLSAVTADLANLRSSVEELMSNSVGKMQDEIDELTKWRKHIYDHKLKSLTQHYNDLSELFKELQSQSETVTGQVGTTIKSNQRVYDADPAESLTTLLTIDTNMRNLREKLVRLEAGMKSSTPALLSLKDEILCIIGEDEALEQITNIEDMLTTDFDKVMASMNQASTSLKQHDAILAERWRSLSDMLKAVKEVSNISSKIEMMESTIDGKVAHEEMEEAVKPHVDSALVKALKPVEDKQTATTNQITVLTDRVTKVEVSVDDAAMEGKPLTMSMTPPPSNTEVIRNSSEMAGLSELLNGGGDIEGALGPMIKNLVEMYCADWENGSHDSYDRSYDSHDMHDDAPYLDAHEFSQPDRSARSEVTVNEDVAGGQGTQQGANENVANENVDKNFGVNNQPPIAHDVIANDEFSEPPQSAQSEVFNQTPLDNNTPLQSVKSSPRASQNQDNPPPQEQQRQQPQHQSQQQQPQKQQQQHPQKQKQQQSESTNNDAPSGRNDSTPVDQGGQKPKQSSGRPSRVSGVKDRPSRSTRVGGQAAVGDDSTASASTRENARSRGRGRGRDGGGVDPAELQGLRQDVARLNEKLTDMNQKKIDVDAVKLLMSQKADNKSLAQKVDTNVVNTIEDAVKECLRNIGDMKQMQGDEIQELKADLGSKIKASLKQMFKSKEDEGKGTNASTKSVCLTCGQDSPMRVHPTNHPHPSFLPALNSNATVGPDVLRGGFKMPVKVPVKVSKYAEFLDPEMAREISAEMSIKAAGGLKKSNTLAPEAIGEAGFDSMHSASMGNIGSRSQPLVRPSSQSTASYVEDQNSIRPLFRKGFPAKKSSRPSAYAPERYELDPSIQVMSKK